MNLEFHEYLLIAVAGVATGIINTLAGSGSLVTLPIFMFICGLPPTVANGTNRVGVLVQTIIATAVFRKSEKVNFGHIGWLLIPAIIGSIIGTLLAVDMNDRAMNYTIMALMGFMLIVILANPKRWLRDRIMDTARNKRPLTVIIFFLIGIYGGFIQAGVGIFLLAALVLISGYDLVSANAVKILVVLVFTIPALIIFMYNDQVHWAYGTLMAVCQAVGSYIGAKFATRYPGANVWIRNLLILIVLASILKFAGFYEWIANMWMG
jgi:uncharacterized membrane protein YfcA